MTSSEPASYIGRFAPSPTGPLHFGSLLAAVASYLQARTIAGGQWLLRIEDIDPPREQPGADKLIIKGLEAYGFEWDGPISYQSRNTPNHERLVDQLLQQGLAYPCACSRRDLAAARRGPLGVIYPGTCRQGCSAKDVAIRLRTDADEVTFTDILQGPQSQNIEHLSGDFIIKRRDGLIAYQLAVVADDYAQSISEVVRGVDLLDSTPRQIFLQQRLRFPTPAYLHIPVVENRKGQKLSKLTGASGIPLHRAGKILVAALEALRQAPPPGLEESSLTEIWSWAIAHWQVQNMNSLKMIPADHDPLAETENQLS